MHSLWWSQIIAHIYLKNEVQTMAQRWEISSRMLFDYKALYGLSTAFGNYGPMVENDDIIRDTDYFLLNDKIYEEIRHQMTLKWGTYLIICQCNCYLTIWYSRKRHIQRHSRVKITETWDVDQKQQVSIQACALHQVGEWHVVSIIFIYLGADLRS